MKLGNLWRHRWPVLRWTVLALVLTGVSGALHVWLSPEPRWSRRGQFDGKLLPDGAAFAYWDPVVFHGVGRRSPLSLVDIATGELTRSVFDGVGMITYWALSPDGRYVAAVPNNGGLRIADLKSGEEWQAMDGLPMFGSSSFSRNGEHLAVVGVNPVGRLLHTRTGRLVHSWPSGWRGAMFSDGADYLIIHTGSPSDESGVSIWDLQRGAVATQMDRAEPLAVSADGKTVYVQRKTTEGKRFDRVIVWDLVNNRSRAEIGTIASDNLNLAVSLDEKIAALWSESAEADDAGRDGRGFLEFWDLPSAKLLASGRITFDIGEGTFSPDGRSFVILDMQQLAAYDTNTGRELWQQQYAMKLVATVLFFTSDSRMLVVRTRTSLEWREAATGTLLETRFYGDSLFVPATKAWRRDRIVAFEMSADLQRPAPWWDPLRRWLPVRWMPSEDLLGVYVFDVRSRRTLFEFAAPAVLDAILSDDGETLLTVHQADDEQILRCWDVPARKPLRWVVGVPLGILLTLLMLRDGWRLGRRRAAQSVTPLATKGAPA